MFQKIITLFLVILAYFPTFWWIADNWFDQNSYYNHGPLVVIISALLVYQKRNSLKNIKVDSSPWGLKLFTIGIAIHLLGSLLQVHFASAFSLLPVIFGLILYFYGKNFLKELLFPLSFLIFALPLPSVIVVNLSFQLKLLSAHIAAILLNHLGLPAIEEGSVIKLKHTYILVEDVCSGLRSLISLLALGSLFAYWLNSNPVKKIILFLLAVPVAMITNAFRIVLLSIVSEIYGTSYASGAFHQISGYMVLILAFIFLYALSKLLE